MKKVLTFGVFDYFHYGHLKLFQECRKFGDHLIVGVQDGAEAARLKQDQIMLYTNEERLEMIRALRIVDEAFLYHFLCEEVMEAVDFDVLALGELHRGGRFDVIESWCREHGRAVVRLKRTPGISSSRIKKEVLERYDETTNA